jgi:hypothetical protein
MAMTAAYFTKLSISNTNIEPFQFVQAVILISITPEPSSVKPGIYVMPLEVMRAAYFTKLAISNTNIEPSQFVHTVILILITPEPSSVEPGIYVMSLRTFKWDVS